MISYKDLKEIAEQLDLIILENDQDNDFNLLINHPLFQYSQGRQIDGSVMCVNFSKQSIWLFQNLEEFYYPWDGAPHWQLANKDEDDKGKKYKNETKEFFIEEIKKIILTVKEKQTNLELEKIKGDFQC